MYLKPLLQHKHDPDHLAEIGRMFLGMLFSNAMDIFRSQIAAILEFIQAVINKFTERCVRQGPDSKREPKTVFGFGDDFPR